MENKEVKVAKWLHMFSRKREDWWECSNCCYGENKEVSFLPDGRTKICPKCGARMENGERDI